MKGILAVGLALLALATGGAHAATRSMGPSKDNTLYESATGDLSNGKGEHFFAGRTNSGGLIRRALLAFDVNSSVPSGSVVSAVRLKFVLTQTSILGSGEVTLSLRRVLVDWGEGGSKALPNEGQGAVAAPGDATWLHRFYPTQNWTVAGGDFSAIQSASLTVNQVGEYTWNSTPEMVADVQSWLDNPATNFGWMILGDESGPLSAKRFASREHLTASVRPLLTIEFTPPIVPGNPVPTIMTIDPATVVEDGAGFTLTVNGSNFIAGSAVNVNGSPRTTAFVSSTQVTASIPAGDITTPGSLSITVTTPAPGGGASNAVTLVITAAAAAIPTIHPLGLLLLIATLAIAAMMVLARMI